MTRTLEIANSENVTLKQQVKEKTELLHARKARRNGKGVALEGRFVFSTQEVLEIARSAELDTSERRSAKPKKRGLRTSLEMEADTSLQIAAEDSDSECIVVSMHK